MGPHLLLIAEDRPSYKLHGDRVECATVADAIVAAHEWGAAHPGAAFDVFGIGDPELAEAARWLRTVARNASTFANSTLVMTVLGESGNRYPIRSYAGHDGVVYAADLVAPTAPGAPDRLCCRFNLNEVLTHVAGVEQDAAAAKAAA